MQDQHAVTPHRKRRGGSARTRLRIGLAVAAATAAAAISGAGVASAQVTSTPTTAVRCDHPCTNPPPGGGWRYVDNFFWASSCIGAGNRGIDNHLWARYQCYGSTWTNYDLWVHQ